MLPEIASLALCTVLALVLRRRPLVVLVVVQALVLLMPISVQEYYFPGIHPAALLILAHFVIAPRPPGRLRDRIAAPAPGLHVAAVVLALFSTQLPEDLASFAKIIATILLAPLAFALTAWRAGGEGDSRTATTLRNAMFVLLGINVGAAALQQLLSAPLIFEQININYFNWGVATSGRRAGMMGTPLDLGLLCAVVTPLAATILSPSRRYLLISVCLGGAVLAQSRTSLLAVACLSAFVLLSGGRRLVGNVVASAVILAGGAYLANTRGFFGDIRDRFAGGYGDTYRSQAYAWFFENLDEFTVFGFGPFSDPRSTGATTSSLENTYLIYAYNFGLVFATILLCIHLTYVRRCGQSTQNALALAASALTFVVMICSYSSVAATPQLALVLAMVAGQATLATRRRPESGGRASNQSPRAVPYPNAGPLRANRN